MYYITSNNNVGQIFNLANSLIIKSHVMAVHMNIQLESKMGVQYDSNDLSTWPYYRNLAGLPHNANTEIVVSSIDTGTNVVMDNTFKNTHPKTYAKLMTYDVFYDALINKYVGQELYIIGMLNPTDIDVIISSEDGTILYYNRDYVEYNEQSLIPTLEVNIKGYMARWLFEEYILTDNLYLPGFWKTMVGFIVKKIYNIRHRNIITYEVNEYYKTVILNSHMNLGLFASVLSKDVKLWLVKNIEYINYNIGKHEILKLIVDKIFRPSNIYVDEIVLERVRTENVEGLPETVTDQVYIRDFETDKSIKYNIDDLASMYHKAYLMNSDIDLKNIINVEDKRLSEIRDIETKTKYLILTNRYTDIMSLIYNVELLFGIIVVSLDTDESIRFTLKCGKTIYTTKKELLRTFIYLLLKYHGDSDFHIENVIIHSIISNTASEYGINYTPISDYLNVVKSNIDTILQEESDFVKQQHEIYKYLQTERSNLPDDFFRFEFDRFVHSIRDESIINIDVNNNLSNDLLSTVITFEQLFEAICEIMNISIPDNDRADMFKNIMDRLTSYTINAVVANNTSDAFIPDHTMKLEGPTIATIDGATLDCRGAVAEPTPMADTRKAVIRRGNNDILFIEDMEAPIFFTRAVKGSTRIVKDRMLIDIIDAGD